MSGESSTRTEPAHEPLERVFGERTRCSACLAESEGYRVLALFLHDHAIVRAYCPECYGSAAEGDYSTRGESVVLDFDAFVARFGCPGPRPRATAVDRALLALMRDSELSGLWPASECFARRNGPAPFRFTAGYRVAGAEEIAASFLMDELGAVLEFDADPVARARVERALGSLGPR